LYRISQVVKRTRWGVGGYFHYLGRVYFLITRFIVSAMRLTEPACRLSFAVISRIGAPSRTSRIKARFSASVHSFGFGLIARASSTHDEQ